MHRSYSDTAMKMHILISVVLFSCATSYASQSGKIVGDLAQVLARIASAQHKPILAEIDAVGPVISITELNAETELSALKRLYPQLHIETEGPVLRAWTEGARDKSKLASVFKTYRAPSNVEELNSTFPQQLKNSKHSVASRAGAYSGFGNPELANIRLSSTTRTNSSAESILLETLTETKQFGVIFVAQQQHFYFFPLSHPIVVYSCRAPRKQALIS